MPLLVLLFIVVPIAEIWFLIQVGEVIGVLPTILLLIVMSVVGARLLKREGLRAWRSFTLALQESRMPAREVADGALVLFGGALLLTPGFLTDILGFVLVLPPSRAVVRRILLGWIGRRFVVVGAARNVASRARRPSAGGRVVEGETIPPPD